MRRRPLPPLYLLVLVLPLGGLALVGRRCSAALRDLRLLRHGAETRGELIFKRPTGLSFHKTPVLALTFAYEVDGKTYTTTVETMNAAALEDDAREAMLYDPHSPSRATTLDHLPGSPRITAGGELEARPGFVVHLLILPVLFVGLAVATVYRMI